MRKTFFESLYTLAKNDKNIILLSDDLGYSFIEPFQKRFPKQYYNCGITEEAMTGIAAGLAHEGKKVYIYGTIPFVIMRNFEFIRNDICENKNKVIIAGVSHSGFLGASHNIFKDEDAKILEHLPNLDIYIPKTKNQLQNVMVASYSNINSAYIRL